VNNLLVAFYFNRLRGTPLVSTWLSDVKELLVSNLLSIPTAALLAIFYKTVGPAVLLAYLVYLPLQRRAHVLYLQQKRIYDQAINSLVLAIDANFPQGRGHSRRVANVAAAIARQMRLSDKEVETIELAALLHDVGLIGTDLSSELEGLSEPSARFREHTRIGAELVRELPRRGIAGIIRHHHEKHDGTGYPDGLKGNEIPRGARILAVAEAFDSKLSGELLGKHPRSVESILNQMKGEAGKSFDPLVVDNLASAIESGAIDWLSLQQPNHDIDPLPKGLGTQSG